MTVTVPDNAIPEEDGWQRINLAASGGGADGATRNVNFYFRDNDGSKPALTVSGSGQDLVEGGDAVAFSVWNTECAEWGCNGDGDPRCDK